ncbi:MAG: biotin transporter BioY [Eubacteriales bacterium]|nr:biotin transporter BioY [Eubacteriales bacterium]
MKTKQLLLCALFAALTACGSLIKIPIPGTTLILTFQVFFMIMAGLMLRARYALISQLVYAAVGLAGLPVFSAGGGIAYVLFPSFGFVIGFCVSAPVISLLVRKNLLSLISKQAHNKGILVMKITIYALVSLTVMYVFGVAYMYIINNIYLSNPITIGYIIMYQAGIFFFIDMAKFALAVPLCAAILKRMPRGLLD